MSSDANARLPSGSVDVVQRLLADAVACKDEPLASGVPERDREHPRELGGKVDPTLLVHMRDHRGVARARHLVAAGGEVAAHVGKVVKLAVEHRDDVAGLVRHGLLAGLEIDDAEPAMTEDAAPERCHAAGVRPAMDERVGHARHEVRVGRSGGGY